MPPRSRPLPRRLAPLALAATLAGCATGKPPPIVRWPAPPDPERVRYVRTFQSEEQFKTSAFRKALRTLVPSSSENAVGQPTGLALSADEATLYVACAALGRVLAIDRAAGKFRKIAEGEEGKRPNAPFAVAVDSAENVYLSDSAHNLVWVYAREGKLLRKFGAEQLERPTGLAIDRRRQILYVVSGATQKSDSHRIEVFSLDGKHLRSIGTRGDAPGEFNFPVNLAVGPDGTLYVVDMLNFRVQLFDPEGQLLGFFGEPGVGEPGTFNKAKGIALDSLGNIYVTDSQGGYVQMFDPKHQVLMAFSGRGKDRGSMFLPTSIVIDSKNTIYVADYYGHVVHEFQLVNASSDASPTGATTAAKDR